MMNFKQFLKPDWRKIVIFIVLLIIFLSYKYHLLAGELPFLVKGLPLPIYVKIPYDVGFIEGSDHPLLRVFLIIDLIFWYLLSCLIIWIFDKAKKKS